VSYRELLLGCGRARDKRLVVSKNPAGEKWSNLTTLDVNPEVKPDVIFDLNKAEPWPFRDDTFDEVHAYEVLEHLGRQGDTKSFFRDFFEAWRVLKPNGFLVGTAPSRYSQWLWGDPGHTRAILPCMWTFLDQTVYTEQCDKVKTSLSDYRYLWRGDFHLERVEDDHTFHRFILRAMKPARIGDERHEKSARDRNVLDTAHGFRD